MMSLGVLLSQTGSVGIKSQYTMLILFVYYIYYLTGQPRHPLVPHLTGRVVAYHIEVPYARPCGFSRPQANCERVHHSDQ